MTVRLGDRARDTITGFDGIVTGKCQYISGCDQVLIQPPVKDGDFKESRWFDSDRCQVVDEQVVLPYSVSSPQRPGFDRPAPNK